MLFCDVRPCCGARLHLRTVSDLAAEVTRLCGEGWFKRFELAALTGEAPLPLQGDISNQC